MLERRGAAAVGTAPKGMPRAVRGFRRKLAVVSAPLTTPLPLTLPHNTTIFFLTMEAALPQALR